MTGLKYPLKVFRRQRIDTSQDTQDMTMTDGGGDGGGELDWSVKTASEIPGSYHLFLRHLRSHLSFILSTSASHSLYIYKYNLAYSN